MNAMQTRWLSMGLMTAVALFASRMSRSAEPIESASATASTPDLMQGRQAGDVRDDNGLKMAFVWCPPGQFKMGSPKSEAGRLSKENLVEATLTKGFWLGRTEVTQGQWEKVLGTTPWKTEKGFRKTRLEKGILTAQGPVTSLAPDVKEGADCAATYMTWEEAIDFCRKLTEQERAADRLPADWEYTLPREVQWEYACRAGTTSVYSFGDDESLLGDYAWWGGLSGHGTAETQKYAHPVGTKLPNPWGLCDMHGNVQEWCRDWESNLVGGVDPVAPGTGTYRVARGGDWSRDASCNRSAMRFGHSQTRHRSAHVGLRVALSR